MAGVLALLLVLAAVFYLPAWTVRAVVRWRRRHRAARTGAAPVSPSRTRTDVTRSDTPAAEPGADPTVWTPLDDRQLIRLLKDSAP
ncbi:MAG: hypothetical protein ACXVW6_07145 [Nocardioidaceae bacterium]